MHEAGDAITIILLQAIPLIKVLCYAPLHHQHPL